MRRGVGFGETEEARLNNERRREDREIARGGSSGSFTGEIAVRQCCRDSGGSTRSPKMDGFQAARARVVTRAASHSSLSMKATDVVDSTITIAFLGLEGVMQVSKLAEFRFRSRCGRPQCLIAKEWIE